MTRLTLPLLCVKLYCTSTTNLQLPSEELQLDMGSVVLPHLVTGWHVDQAIMSEEERLVVIRFGRDWDPDCMRQDEVLYRKCPLHVSFISKV